MLNIDREYNYATSANASVSLRDQIESKLNSVDATIVDARPKPKSNRGEIVPSGAHWDLSQNLQNVGAANGDEPRLPALQSNLVPTENADVPSTLPLADENADVGASVGAGLSRGDS